MKSSYLNVATSLVLIFTGAVLSARLSAQSLRWGVNDVSILAPLPANAAELDRMLKLTDVGAKGALMPLGLFQQFRPSKLVDGEQQDTSLYPLFRVLSLRVDPCSGPECRNELRLVAQPLQFQPEVHVIDFSFHLTYVLSSTEMTSLLADLWQFKLASPISTSEAALGIHPGLASAGIDSAYYEQLKAIVLRYVGQQNLFRVTTTNLQLGAAFSGAPMAFFWNFKSVLRGADDVLVPELIPTFQQTEQVIVVRSVNELVLTPGQPAPPLEQVILTIDPILPVGDDLIAPFLKSAADIIAMSDTDVQRATDATYRIENPNIHRFENTDCLSCHVAAKAREVANAFRGALPEGNDRYSSAAGNDHVENNSFATDFRLLRAFSYGSLGSSPSLTRPSIIPRTVFESVEVARRLNETH